ncbi:MAG: hypothetical protein IKE64_13250 [Thermoguttaceae bacterium]|nr:hypothetical protein [Thermoguttaceae bacterium]
MKASIYGSILCVILSVFLLGCSEKRSVQIAPVKQDSAGEQEAAPSVPAEPQVQTREVPAAAGVTHRSDFDVSANDTTAMVPMSIVTAPLAAYFNAEEMTVFNIQIPHTMSLYQAETGEYPKSQEEFMTNIIERNQIVLPKLREGDSYHYDVQTHTLMVQQTVMVPEGQQKAQ